MAMPDSNFDWQALQVILQKQTKAALIDLIQELVTASPTVQQFLQARYLHIHDMAAQIRPYQERIDAQFEGDEPWDKVQSDFQEIGRIIREYRLATREEPEGTTELYVYALESAAGFMLSMGIHDMDYHNDVAELAWQCVSHFNNFPALYPPYVNRLREIVADLNQFDWEELTTPFYQLEADMDNSEELL